MDDVREVGAELRRLAEAEQLDPFDTATLLQRGRRGRRRRKLLAVGGTVVSVAAVAVAAAVLPNLDTAGDGSRVAGGGEDAGQANSSFEPVPGVPRGEESAGQKMSKEEAERRCALRYPQYTRPLDRGLYVSGRTIQYETAVGQKFQECTIPGGDKPSAELIAAAKRDPMPTTAAGQLRNCSVNLWVDLTNWRVTASDQVKGFATSLVAVSPSGRKAVSCLLDPSADTTMMGHSSSSMFLTLNALDASDPVVPGGSGYAELRAGSSGSAHCPGTPCKGWYALEYGRVASNITKVRIQLTGYPQVHEVTVTDGWYAIAWLNQSFKGSDPHYTITGYDKAGKAVKVIAKT